MVLEKERIEREKISKQYDSGVKDGERIVDLINAASVTKQDYFTLVNASEYLSAEEKTSKIQEAIDDVTEYKIRIICATCKIDYESNKEEIDKLIGINQPETILE